MTSHFSLWPPVRLSFTPAHASTLAPITRDLLISH
uniref:Uncharacterized protein n=1 Tax=Anguilla anguilla TaxID=7936 RepID=A0A0E9SID8_ANGAN